MFSQLVFIDFFGGLLFIFKLSLVLLKFALIIDRNGAPSGMPFCHSFPILPFIHSASRIACPECSPLLCARVPQKWFFEQQLLRTNELHRSAYLSGVMTDAMLLSAIRFFESNAYSQRSETLKYDQVRHLAAPEGKRIRSYFIAASSGSRVSRDSVLRL
jgi:hypothetical protein